MSPLQWEYAKPEPKIILDRESSEQHKPTALPAILGPAIRCSCGVTMFAATDREVGACWRAHLLNVVGLRDGRSGSA